MAISSELNTQQELDLPCSLVERCQGGKAGVQAGAAVETDSKSRGAEKGRRVIQVGVVQEVKDVGAEGQTSRFSQLGEGNHAAQRKVHIEQTRSAERISACISRQAARRVHKCRRIEQQL